MYCVQISARIIHWPISCPCCGRPADTAVKISSTRTTGVEVIRTQTKSWDVPYCNRCLSHVHAAKELEMFSWVVIHLSLVISLVGTALSLLVLGLIFRKSVTLAALLSLLVIVVAVVLL